MSKPPEKKQPKRQPKDDLVLRGQSCQPDGEWMDRVLEPHPLDEDVAILEAWAPRFRWSS